MLVRFDGEVLNLKCYVDPLIFIPKLYTKNLSPLEYCYLSE